MDCCGGPIGKAGNIRRFRAIEWRRKRMSFSSRTGRSRKGGGREVMEPLPFVYLNLAMTADGKIATADRGFSRFGSRRDLEHLYELRCSADAILCGATTLNVEDADLGAGPERFRRRRVAKGMAEHPVRVVVSGSGKIDKGSRLFRRRFGPVVILVTGRVASKRLREIELVADAVRVSGDEEIDVVEALRWLRAQWNVKRLLCEGGGQLNDALFRAGVVREVHVTVCPVVVGGELAPTLSDGVGAARLGLATQCRLKHVRRVGKELFAVFSVVAGGGAESAD
jgi:2,5-diamino-6-(ribosylamino)-4(3H)-pyrimidinone 5'-phosphate reductase